ncbi:hypothetical protein [Thiothrix subterranea]|uniref:Uncharacterized protein n=1 Tax=Thiothrix subterranea TaxID=2735563 RepID=A0AA51MM74_9GAMM|nr:hypothetical protein [Thiothrix subterranea]MDQ5770865.1 hypothetical protein [Thiothrix subterranea]WML84902.1 hypothetical protein RCG00_00275 [Thiothrix subterranea]
MKAIKASALLLAALFFSGIFATASAATCIQPGADNAPTFERNSHDSSAWFDELSING